MEEKLRKKLYFSDKCIWGGSCKLSQSWSEHLPSEVNVLTNTLKISPHTRGHIFLINFNENHEKKDKNTLMEILQVFGMLSHGDCESLFWNTTF